MASASARPRPEPRAAGAQVEPLHLAGAGVGEGPQRRAAERPAVGVAGDQQGALRRGVLARQVGDLALEALVAEIDGQRLGIGAQQLADGGEVFRRRGGGDEVAWDGHVNSGSSRASSTVPARTLRSWAWKRLKSL